MKIDEQVESLVREALDASIKQDIDRLDSALDAFTDDTKRRDGMVLLFLIGRQTLYELYEGRTPTEKQVSDLADWIADEDSWAGLPAQEIANYLLWLLGDDSKTVNHEMYIVLIFVVTAVLLSLVRRPEGYWWFDTLDRIEAMLEAALDPS